jgi:molybdopterin-guanine dinucleotide biosynthesis protein
MIEIIEVNQLKPGDIILIEGFNESEFNLVTVEDISEDGLIVPEEMGGMDYCPEDSDQIVRLGNKNEAPILHILTQGIHLGLSKEWYEKFLDETDK